MLDPRFRRVVQPYIEPIQDKGKEANDLSARQKSPGTVLRPAPKWSVGGVLGQLWVFDEGLRIEIEDVFAKDYVAEVA